MITFRGLIVGLCVFVGCSNFVRSQDGPRTALSKPIDAVFVVKPYLQWGTDPAGGAARGLVLAWQADDVEADWSLEFRPGLDRPWVQADAPSMRRIAVPNIAPHRSYRASMKGLVPGGRFSYRLNRAGRSVFEAEGTSPKSADQPYRFVAFGDCGVNGPEQKQIAYRTYLEHPDFVFIPGDIVYDRGRISEYLAKFWPIYNADESSPTLGAPCSARRCSWPHPATTTSPRATSPATRTAWPISSTGTSRSTGRSSGRRARWSPR